jgi:hypothetical protein
VRLAKPRQFVTHRLAGCGGVVVASMQQHVFRTAASVRSRTSDEPLIVRLSRVRLRFGLTSTTAPNCSQQTRMFTL